MNRNAAPPLPPPAPATDPGPAATRARRGEKAISWHFTSNVKPENFLAMVETAQTYGIH